MKRIPSKVDILGYILPVEQHSLAAIQRSMRRRGDDEAGQYYMGYLDPHKRIVIGKELAVPEKWEVLIHEIGHELELTMSCIGIEHCDIGSEPIHAMYHRLLTGVMLTNGMIA